MKARIIKKLSKKIKNILPKEFECSWVDNEIMDDSYDQGSRVSRCLMVGGELDYWGEGTEYYSVISAFADSLVWLLDLPKHPVGHEFEGLPNTTKIKRLTGQYMISVAKNIAINKDNKQ